MEDNKTLPITEGQYILDDEIALNVAQIIRKRVDSFMQHRRKLLIEIKANIAYLVGEQNILLENGQIVPIKNARMINPVSNLILPAVQKDIAVATQTQPQYDIVPAGTDDDDKATAIVADKIWQHLLRIHGRDVRRVQTVLWYDIAGIGWRKVYWNPYKTVIGINPPPTDEMGNPNPAHNPDLPVGEAIMQGEVEIDAIPPTQLIYDFRETDLSKLDWIIHAKRVTRQWVLDRFGPEVAGKLQGQFQRDLVESEFSNLIDRKFAELSWATEAQTLVTPKMSDNSMVHLDADDLIDYYEYWQKPSKQMPTGMLAIMLGDQVVSHSPYPIDDYPHGQLPFIYAAPMSLGAGLGTSIPRISQARPLQREYNRMRAMIAENLDVMGNAVFMAPRSAKLRFRTLDNGAGNIIEYDGPIGKPTREPGVPMNSQVFQYLLDIKQSIETLMAFNEVTRGMAPRNIESGRGIMALQDADRVHMIPIVSAFEEADQKVAYQAISLAMAHYEQGRLIHCVGSDYEWTLYEIDRKQLLGHFNVIIKPLSSLPKNKEAEAMQAFSIWQSGLLGDPNDPELRLWTLEQMKLGNLDNVLQKHSKHRNFAMKEFSVAYQNLKEINIPPDVPKEVLADEIQKRTFVPHANTFDDHLVHLAAHNEFLLDKYWEMVASNNVLVLELLKNLMLHVQEHQLIIQQQQMAARQAEIEAQMLIKGTTPAQMALRKAGMDGPEPDKKGKE